MDGFRRAHTTGQFNRQRKQPPSKFVHLFIDLPTSLERAIELLSPVIFPNQLVLT